MENEKVKSSKGLAILVVILILIIFCLLGYILYDKVLNKPETETPIVEKKPNEIEKDTAKVISFDKETINKKLNESLGDIAEYDISKVYNRFTIVSFLLNSVANWTDGEDFQDTPYIELNVYKNKYKEVFGEFYSFDEDYKNIGDCEVVDLNDEHIEEGNVSWIGVIDGADPSIYEFEASSLLLNEETNIYTLKGEYSLFTAGEIDESGNFTIEFGKTDGVNHLKSMKLD